MGAMSKQIGGDHYKNMVIQPVEFIMKNRLNFLQGLAIKYLVRYKEKSGVEDLDKVIHCVEMLKEMDYPQEILDARGNRCPACGSILFHRTWEEYAQEFGRYHCDNCGYKGNPM